MRMVGTRPMFTILIFLLLNNLFGVVQDVGNQDHHLGVVKAVDHDLALSVLLDQVILAE